MKAFIISLSKIPSSADSSQKVLQKLLEYNIDAELFEGTYGYDAEDLFEKDNRRIANYGIKTELISRNEYLSRFSNVQIPENIINV